MITYDVSGDNSNIPNVGVIITDGRSNDHTQTWQQAMTDRNNNIDLIAIGKLKFKFSNGQN